MAISKKKTRIQVTIHRDLADIVREDAEKEKSSASEVIAQIVAESYEKLGRYKEPKEK